MRRLLAGLVVAVGIALARKVAGTRFPKLLERMMERVAPRVMDSCFAQMSAERREFMLSHCRAMLDAIEEKYVTPQPA